MNIFMIINFKLNSTLKEKFSMQSNSGTLFCHDTNSFPPPFLSFPSPCLFPFFPTFSCGCFEGGGAVAILLTKAGANLVFF